MQGTRTRLATVVTTVLATGVMALLPAVALLASSPAHAATNDLSLVVTSARGVDASPGVAAVTKGQAVTDYQFLINLDTTGDTSQHQATGACSPSDASYPAGCGWTSINAAPDAAPIVAQGSQADLPLSAPLPDGDYLISVLADGYKFGGVHFSMPADGPVAVELEPMPLPDATVRGQVFIDDAPTNGTFDADEVAPDPRTTPMQGHLNDLLGEVTTDVYGNPLCTTYVGENADHTIDPADLDAEGNPQVLKVGKGCFADADGVVTFPHMGTNRYTQYVSPPDDQTWLQTSTLEGHSDWDTWVMEGATGYDTEFTLAGEAVPTPLFGFVQPLKDGQAVNGTATGSISGRVMKTLHYVPPKGGYYDLYNGFTGSKLDGPITDAWLSLADLESNDRAVWVGHANANGRFTIGGVPDGEYLLTWWDESQRHLLALQNVTVADGQAEEVGMLPMTGWWTEYSGYVFDDSNRNGRRDPGEQGIPNFTLTLRKRDNSLMDRGITTAVTDANGFYTFDAYPLGEFGWTVMEAYADNFYTTGVTYQPDNQPEPTTLKGAGVDVSTLNIIGLTGSIDWGVHAYDPGPNRDGGDGPDPSNGGIVGSVSYDTTRNEFDPQYAASEDWQPGVPGLTVELHDTVTCEEAPDSPCDEQTGNALGPNGEYRDGGLLNTYVTEEWQKPTGCTARDLDGTPLVHGVDEGVLALNQETDGVCVPAFSQSIQFGAAPTDQGTPDASFGVSVNGNYGFGDGCFDGTVDATDPANPSCDGGTFTALPAGDYLVTLDIPEDQYTQNPLYKVTEEEDINVANGNQMVPQKQVPPPACAGAMHTVDLAGTPTLDPPKPDGYDATTLPFPTFNQPDDPAAATVAVPASEPVENQPFLDMDGTPYEGQARRGCQSKLVELANGKSIVPMFNIFTDVPLPSRLRGLIIDDVNFSADIRSTAYGEKAGVPFVPVGIYDFDNRLITTVESDYNGFYDVLLPSTNHISCPTPSGVCAGMYRFVGNDPGVPGRLNPSYNPRYRTIGTEFEALPGVTVPTDLAPTQVGMQLTRPGTGQQDFVTCPIGDDTPQLLRVDRPYVTAADRSFSIEGNHLGSGGTVTLDGTALTVDSWSDTTVDVTVPGSVPNGPHQMVITGSNGKSAKNGLTIHVLGQGYNPNLIEVGQGSGFGYHTIQAGLTEARRQSNDDLVVVYPNTPTLDNPTLNPRGAYYENVVMSSPAKLQGVGPGGFRGSTYVGGSIIDGGAFSGDQAIGDAWYSLVGDLQWDGNQDVNDGQAVYVLASNSGNNGTDNPNNLPYRARQFTAGFKAGIDGFDIRGGNQQGFPGNINENNGTPSGLPANIQTQGGAIFANAYARYLQITNNVVENNGGAYGTIRIGTPDLPGNDANQHNTDVRIAHNRIIANAGTNLAGAVGLFGGSDRYEVAANDICGNFSLEYGGGVSVYGRSPNGRIHHNRIYYNESVDEGGGIMIAGALPATPSQLSTGSGSVDISANQIQANLSNDDGGGIRFLMAGADRMRVVDNTIVNNVSTHEGGGIALNDAPNVDVVNNTIMKNLTTATAVTSNGDPAPAGLSTSRNSDQLQATLGNAPGYSNPRLLNNVFWDNRAGSRNGLSVSGLGLPGDPGAPNHWDIGMLGDAQNLSPLHSVVQQSPAVHPYTTDPSNSDQDPQVVSTYDVSVAFATWRQNPSFVDATLVALEAPGDQLGDYHLSGCPASPACNLGAATGGGATAPTTDIDDELRPALGGYDAGSDEFGSTPAPPVPPVNQTELLYSTSGNANPLNGTTQVPGTADDADIYRWDGSAHSRNLDLSAAPYNLPSSGGNNADVDGYSRASATQFFISLSSDVNMSAAGLGIVQDEDILFWNGTAWQVYDMTGRGLGGNNGLDIDGLSVAWPMVYFSTAGNSSPPNVGGQGDDADVYAYDADPLFTGNRFTREWDASANGLQSDANVDGLDWISAGDFHVSFSSDTTVVPGLGNVTDESVVHNTGGTWVTTFDGPGLHQSGNQDVDAFSLVDSASAPPPATAAVLPPFGAIALSLLGGDLTSSAANLYGWDGSTYGQQLDLTAAPYGLAATAKVDGLDLQPGGSFYLSFATDTAVPGLGTVQDEDVVRWDDSGHWQLSFDGTRRGLTRAAQDIGDITVAGAKVYFTTAGNRRPPGVSGRGDDADVYVWNGHRFRRAWDATRNGVPRTAALDGLVWIGRGDLYVSFRGATTRLPGFGRAQDEDVVHRTGGAWTPYFDGTLQGLTGTADDVDAFDLPPTDPTSGEGVN